MTSLPPEAQGEVNELLAQFPNKRSALLMVLRVVERQFGCIDDRGMALAAEACEVSVAHVQGAVTFYSHYKRPHHGKHRFMVCATLMCAMGGHCDRALAQIEARLGIKPGERTADGLFSVEKVECLADCHKPPVVQVDFTHHTCFEGAALDQFITSLLREEGKPETAYEGQSGVKMQGRVFTLPVLHDFKQGPAEPKA
ncbi:MAG: NAD(P)H-dependent oxidoreductase subunit E [Myxococcales bacterium]|nr:NAD(P)H-dependent oxidoreductase subunit E [Myxococcales bacterium]